MCTENVPGSEKNLRLIQERAKFLGFNVIENNNKHTTKMTKKA